MHPLAQLLFHYRLLLVFLKKIPLCKPKNRGCPHCSFGWIQWTPRNMTPSNNFLTLLGGEAWHVFQKKMFRKDTSLKPFKKRRIAPGGYYIINRYSTDHRSFLSVFWKRLRKQKRNKHIFIHQILNTFQAPKKTPLPPLRFVANVISLPTAEDHACQAEWGGGNWVGHEVWDPPGCEWKTLNDDHQWGSKILESSRFSSGYSFPVDPWWLFGRSSEPQQNLHAWRLIGWSVRHQRRFCCGQIRCSLSDILWGVRCVVFPALGVV